MADMMIKVLQQIRDELKETRHDLVERIDQTNSRLDQTNSRLDETNSRLERVERRQTAAEVRLATELTAVVGAIADLKAGIVEDRRLRATVANHEARLKALEKRKAS